MTFLKLNKRKKIERMYLTLLIINLVLGIINFNRKNYRTACLSFFVVGVIVSKIITDYIK